jgi:hypothetical protein
VNARSDPRKALAAVGFDEYEKRKRQYLLTAFRPDGIGWGTPIGLHCANPTYLKGSGKSACIGKHHMVQCACLLHPYASMSVRTSYAVVGGVESARAS